MALGNASAAEQPRVTLVARPGVDLHAGTLSGGGRGRLVRRTPRPRGPRLTCALDPPPPRHPDPDPYSPNNLDRNPAFLGRRKPRLKFENCVGVSAFAEEPEIRLCDVGKIVVRC